MISFLKYIRQKVSLLILIIFGWKKGDFSALKNIKKAIFVAAPHTSYWDAFWIILGKFAFLYDKKTFALFKIEANKSFWGEFYRTLGGIPVDRGKVSKGSKSMVKLIVEKIKSINEGLLLISPEGTRSLNKKWKTGFYYIALEANVPIVLSYLDYKKKEFAVSKVVKPTGDFKKDMEKINDYYKNVTAKYPKKFSLNME